MSELKVRRKGYWRGPYDYIRGGKKIHIEKHWVPETTFMTEDREEPGRTPEEDRWFDPKRHKVGKRRRNQLFAVAMSSKQLIKTNQCMIDTSKRDA